MICKSTWGRMGNRAYVDAKFLGCNGKVRSKCLILVWGKRHFDVEYTGEKIRHLSHSPRKGAKGSPETVS